MEKGHSFDYMHTDKNFFSPEYIRPLAALTGGIGPLSVSGKNCKSANHVSKADSLVSDTVILSGKRSISLSYRPKNNWTNYRELGLGFAEHLLNKRRQMRGYRCS